MLIVLHHTHSWNNLKKPTATPQKVLTHSPALEHRHWQILQNHICFIKTTNKLIILIPKYFPLLSHKEQTPNSISVISLVFPFLIFCLLAAVCELTNNVCLCLGFLKRRIFSKWKKAHLISL